jgi:RNA polymerase sigma-70 factor, ECF subfamily
VNVKQPGPDEKQAIVHLKQGDLSGLETLVRRYQVQAIQAAYLIVRDPQAAEDVTQNAFLRMVEKIDQFDESRPFGPWFLRSVINASLRAAQREKRLVPLDHDPEEGDLLVESWLQDPGPDPEGIVETEETRKAVWLALDRLAPEQRAAIVLRHFLEMSAAEMTEELHRPASTIKWWLLGARQRLRELLRPFYKAGNPDHPQGSENEEQG